MKPKVLLIYIDQSAKLGIVPYMSSIFQSYLDFESQLIDQIDFQNLHQYQLILFSSALCRTLAYDSVCDYGIPTYQCRRELNYTYLHRILDIPPGSRVCIVNDRKKNCEAIQKNLLDFGFTQYQYDIYYPGGPSISPSVQYAITPGEARFTPSTVKTVIDIGNRNVDIGTLCKIITFFQLPETILNQVTDHFAGYISNFMRYINLQLDQTMIRTMENEKILDHLECGICITSSGGRICQTNRVFRNMLCIDSSSLSGRTLTDVLKDWNITLELEQLLTEGVILIQNYHGELIDFHFSQKYRSADQETRYLFLSSSHRNSPAASLQSPRVEWRETTSLPGMNTGIFRLLLQNPRLSPVMKLAGNYAETDFPVLILGEPGLYQLPVARFIHGNSTRSANNFLYFDVSNPFFPSADAEGAGSVGNGNPQAVFKHLLENANGETLFLDHLDRSTAGFQAFLCSFFKELEAGRQFNVHSAGSIRIICSAGAGLEEKIKSGEFLPDLFYQAGALILKLPGLSEMQEEIPDFLSFFLKDLFADFSGQPEHICSDQLLLFLKEYSYPGNFREMENLCRYFSCIYEGKRLTLSDLPPYIHYQTPDRIGSLTMQQREILSIIRMHSHCGRNRISVLLAEKGMSMTSYQIRTVMAELAEKDYIRVLKTKQGCEITELGEYMLEKK